MKKILLVVPLLGVGIWAVLDWNKAPTVQASVRGSNTKGILTVTSTPPGGTVFVRLQAPKNGLKIKDGPYRVNATSSGTDWQKIGSTPLEDYSLPTSNILDVTYKYGFLRGSVVNTSTFDCMYDIKVIKDDFDEAILKDVVLTPGNTAKFSVELKQ